MRLFSAVSLPHSALAALEQAQRALGTASFRRWQSLGTAHVTLHFLGEVAPERLPAVEAALADAARCHAPFELALGEWGAFGERRRPRVLWMGLGGDRQALLALQATGQANMAGVGFELEPRPYRPHVTLAREATAPLDWEALPPVPSVGWTVEALSLYASTLRPEGAVHTLLGRYALEGDRMARITL